MNSHIEQLFLWAVGVLQPTNATLVRHFLSKSMPDLFVDLRTADSKNMISELLKSKYVCYSKEENDYLYSLTRLGNMAMLYKIRMHRDKVRLFLLKDASRSVQKFSEFSERGLDLTGAPPVLDSSIDEQGRRPIAPVVAFPTTRGYWPSTFKQLKLDITAGPKPRSDYSDKFEWYSFATLTELSSACNVSNISRSNLTLSQIALAIGISPRLLVAMTNQNQTHHYREFNIKKRTGGMRTIHAPRVFLKTVQRWILNYVLFDLPIHTACHSYRKSYSIITNASIHANKGYVANLDIVDYFGSIKKIRLQCELSTIFGPVMSGWIASLCTFKNALPQGAPTSPALSNFHLRDFDRIIYEHCQRNELAYSRYADDITISGNNKRAITSTIALVIDKLNAYQLRINDKKSRIASRSGQQKVTGVVVNVVPQPPRSFRKRIRAIFHQASLAPQQYIDELDKMSGYLNYLKSFNHLSASRFVKEYSAIIESIKATKH